MKRRAWIVLAIALSTAGGSAAFWPTSREPSFVTAPVERADVVRAIVATGAVNPVVTVQVGSYVSGTVQSISCDFDTRVDAGQVCARIDPRPYQQVVDQAEANLATARAQLRKDEASRDYAALSYQRARDLLANGVVSEDTTDASKSTHDQAEAQVRLDQATIEERNAALEAARVNLDYTSIVSPVTGTVVSRNVDVGQTVAASFQTPTLFLIAQDLGKMQVDTSVSESDVGGARVGQRATFTVEAYPREVFEGRVVQVRKAPVSVQNVITYDVVIGVDNEKLLLFPGMTANARIEVEAHRGVPTVPLPALRFDPNGLAAAAPAGARVWVLREGRPQPLEVTLGLDDGVRAEITSNEPALGEAVIVDQPGRTPGGESEPPHSPFRF